ncbi:MAG TPA: DoxX family protein [Saprospiraceae bacterium]|nr:DoxX family protein [Saprospiraceae bacterium]HRK80928.1 DoxX family protein [Saprospiraceae bacterium]
METTIWVLKAATALLFIFVGINKLMLPKAKLLDKGMKGLINLDEKQIKTAGVLEILGAIGLILPSALNYFPALSSISALCLGLTMIVAGMINYKLKLSIIPNIVIFAVCIFIAYWGIK